MKILKLNGHYVHQGKIGPLEGMIEFDENKEFKGVIIDKISVSPEQMIKGKYFHEDGVDKLRFFKFHPNQNYANIFYEVKKKESGKMSGKYTGEWRALAEHVDSTEDFDNILQKTDINLYIMKNNAEINLSE
jgi:hypothetical protein